MLAIVMVLLSILATMPFMLAGDIAGKEHASQADVIAQMLAVQYQAALTLCPASGAALSACTDPTVDIDTHAALDPDIASGALATSNLIVTRFDDSFNPGPGRIVAFVDEKNGSIVAENALWGEVSAATMTNGGGADGIGFWQAAGAGAATGTVVSHPGRSAYTLARQQGSHQLQDGNPIMVQPVPNP